MVDHKRIWYRLSDLENAIFLPSKMIILVEIRIFLILKAEQQNALDVIFRKVDVDGNNQLDKEIGHQ